MQLVTGDFKMPPAGHLRAPAERAARAAHRRGDHPARRGALRLRGGAARREREADVARRAGHRPHRRRRQRRRVRVPVLASRGSTTRSPCIMALVVDGIPMRSRLPGARRRPRERAISRRALDRQAGAPRDLSASASGAARQPIGVDAPLRVLWHSRGPLMALEIQVRIGAGARARGATSSSSACSQAGRQDARPPALAQAPRRRAGRRAGEAHREGRVHGQARSDALASRPSAASRPTSSSCSASATSASIGAPEVRTFAAKAARIANAEKATTLALSLPAGLEARAARRRPRASSSAPTASPSTSRATASRRRDARAASSIGVAGKSEAEREGAVALGQRVGAGGQPLARPQQRAAERHLPGGASPPPRETAREGERASRSRSSTSRRSAGAG